jgi:hypothetical protein
VSLDARHFHSKSLRRKAARCCSVVGTRLFHRPFIELRGTRREDSIAIACGSCWRAEPGGKSKRANASYDHRVFHQKVVAIIATSPRRSVPKFDVNTSPAHLTTRVNVLRHVEALGAREYRRELGRVQNLAVNGATD